MPRYEAIEIGVPFDAFLSDLMALAWHANGITADFWLPERGDQALRVTFDRPCIVRLLDEMPLSTEDDNSPSEGLSVNRFAYRVHGARFAEMQSTAWKLCTGPVEHFRFITGDCCMDVLSAAQPSFDVISKES